jgi:signal peptidase I
MDPQTRDQAGCTLAAEALRSWGTLKLRATGISMLPTLWPGDFLTVHSLDPEQVRPGDIVLYMQQDRFFVHRMVAANLTRDNAFLITRGDCMPRNDPPVARREVLGRITEVHRTGSVFAPARTRSLFHQLAAWMLCHWTLTRRIALRLWSYRQLRPYFSVSSVSSVVHGFSHPSSTRNGAATN